MAEIKVIAVQAGEEFLAALTKLLGSDVAAAAGLPATESAAEPVEVDEPEFDVDEDVGEDCPACSCPECQGETVEEEADFGEILADEENGDTFDRTYSVVGAATLDVRVTPNGVVVSGSRDDFDDAETFEDTFAPVGAYDEVTAWYNEEEGELTVTLFKVAPEGTEVEIEGWNS